MLVLQGLFSAFRVSTQTRLPLQDSQEGEESFDMFHTLQDRISAVSEGLLIYAGARYIDFIVTKHWMRIVLWQGALSKGLLSANATKDSMNYYFPGRVMRDLLQGLPQVNRETFVAGGQDQV